MSIAVKVRIYGAVLLLAYLLLSCRFVVPPSPLPHPIASVLVPAGSTR